MESKHAGVVLGVCISLLLMGIGQSYADTAIVLPMGVFRTEFKSEFYSTIDERFDPDGNTESVDVDYNATLNSFVFPALAPLDNVLGGPGTAIIGDSIVDFEYEVTQISLSFMYGVTDKLTAGIMIPYAWLETNVKEARLDNANATVGKNPLFGAPNQPPIIPVAVGGVPLTTEDVQALLGAGLIINGQLAVPGFGYKRIENWSDDGFQDIEVGARYQYLKTDDWRLAFTGGVRLPTGNEDDPDNLIDLGFGKGAYALLFRLNNDYIGIRNLVFDVTLKYDLYLPDETTKRVPSDVNNPIAPLENKEKVNRDIGDIFQVETEATYEFFRGWNFDVLYRYAVKQKDDVSGNKGLQYQSLEDETDWTYHFAVVGIRYSTIPMFTEKKFPLPIDASFSYSNVFAGSNNFFKQDFFTLKLAVYF